MDIQDTIINLVIFFTIGSVAGILVGSLIRSKNFLKNRRERNAKNK